jgi:hypothetical protein
MSQESMVANSLHCSVTTQQIYTVVYDIRHSMIITADTRWSFFQAPFVVEDARGFKFPVPSEFDYDMLDNIVRHRFKEGAGSRDVVLGNYEFCKANMRSATIAAISRLAPGTAITMAVILSPATPAIRLVSCPNAHLSRLRAALREALYGRYIWLYKAQSTLTMDQQFYL